MAKNVKFGNDWYSAFFHTFFSFNETKLTMSLNCTALWFNLNLLWNDYNTSVNIHLIQIGKKFVLLRVMRTQNLLSQQFSNVSRGSANYSHQAAHYILEYESSYNWELVVFDRFHPKPVHPIPRLWQRESFSFSVSSAFLSSYI